MTAAAVVAVVAACIAVLTLIASVLVLRKVRGHERILEREIERGKATFDEVVARELDAAGRRARTDARSLRADSLSQLAEEERRIAEERRRDVAERERDATTRLSEQLVAAQAAVEQRLPTGRTTSPSCRRASRRTSNGSRRVNRSLMAEATARSARTPNGCRPRPRSSGSRCARLRADLARAAQEVIQQASAELEQHAAERRRALHEVADRLRKREHDLQELIEREGNEATQRIQLALGDIERRQVEQLQRIVGRETARYTEAASGAVRRNDPHRPRGGGTAAQPRARPGGRAFRPRGGGGARPSGSTRSATRRQPGSRSDSPVCRPPSSGSGTSAGLARGTRAPGRVRAARAFARDLGRCRVGAGGPRGPAAGARPPAG